MSDSLYFCYLIISESDGADEILAVYLWVTCMAHTGYYMPTYNDVGYLVGHWRSGAVPNRHHWMVRARQYRIENMDYVVRKYVLEYCC